MDKPIIGLLGIRILDTSGPVPVVRDFINATYCESVARAGGHSRACAATTRPEDVADALAVCQGLVLPGGLDVDPRLYGEDPLPVLGTVDVQVDELWAAALRCAMERGLPVLGICRGMQLANVALGGSLYQDVTLMRPDCQLHTQRQARDYPLHRVEVEKDSRLARILGTTSVFTNTMHHQCVREPGEGLRVVAPHRRRRPRGGPRRRMAASSWCSGTPRSFSRACRAWLASSRTSLTVRGRRAPARARRAEGRAPPVNPRPHGAWPLRPTRQHERKRCQ